MSTETTHDSWFSRKLGRNRFQAIGISVMLSGALLLGACGGDDDDDDVDIPTTGAGSTITSVTGTTTGSTPTTGTGTTTTGTTTSGTPSTGGTPMTGTPGTDDGDVMSIFEDEFSDRPWFTAVDDVDLSDGEVVVTVNDEAATLTESEVEEMCNEVSDVVFSDVIGAIEEVDMLTVEDDAGMEVASATEAGECTVA